MHASSPRVFFAMNRSLLATLITGVLLSTVPAAAPVEATSAIQRCESPDGTLVYTDKSCAAFSAKAVPMASPSPRLCRPMPSAMSVATYSRCCAGVEPGLQLKIACRDGEEENLKAAARLVDAKSREALSGLGTLSESRQLLFASLLLADQLVEGGGAALIPEPPDPVIAEKAAALADRLEALATSLENAGAEA